MRYVIEDHRRATRAGHGTDDAESYPRNVDYNPESLRETGARLVRWFLVSSLYVLGVGALYLSLWLADLSHSPREKLLAVLPVCAALTLGVIWTGMRRESANLTTGAAMLCAFLVASLLWVILPVPNWIQGAVGVMVI